MGKTIRKDSKYPHASEGKTRPLGSNKRQDPLNQAGVHVSDEHVKTKRLHRVWPKVNERTHGRRKV